MYNYLVTNAVLDLQVTVTGSHRSSIHAQASQRVINRKFGKQIVSQWRQCVCSSNCELPRKRLEEFSLFPRHLRCNRLWKQKHDRQWTWNVTYRRGRATIVAVESSEHYIFRVCVCSLGTQRALRLRSVVICGLSGSTIFFHIFS